MQKEAGVLLSPLLKGEDKYFYPKVALTEEAGLPRMIVPSENQLAIDQESGGLRLVITKESNMKIGSPVEFAALRQKKESLKSGDKSDFSQ